MKIMIRESRTLQGSTPLWCWVAVYTNGQTAAASEQVFATEARARNAAERFVDRIRSTSYIQIQKEGE